MTFGSKVQVFLGKNKQTKKQIHLANCASEQYVTIELSYLLYTTISKYFSRSEIKNVTQVQLKKQKHGNEYIRILSLTAPSSFSGHQVLRTPSSQAETASRLFSEC